ncbi:PAS domain-containing sensor histidine kinase [Kaarinaea lacus]
MPENFSLTDIIKHTNDVVIVTRADDIDPPGPEIVYVNEAFTRLTGYKTSEVIGKNPRLLQGPKTCRETTARIREALLNQEPVRAEIINYSKSGEEYWLELQIIPLKDHKGKVTHFAAIERDITERHRAEQALREHDARLQTIVASMAEGVVVQDQSGFINSCNEAAEKILGLTQDQMMGRTSIDPRWAAIREDGSNFPGEEHPAMVTLRTGEPLVNIIMGIRKPTDVTTWISINTRPIYLNYTDKPDAVVATFHDITEQRRADQTKSEFISTVSHELRTPLTSIRGAIGLLEGGMAGDLPPKVKEMIAIAMRNVDRLSSLINDLLDMEKISSGNMAMKMKEFDVGEVVNKALAANQPYASRYNVRFVCNNFSPAIKINVDEGRILQVLTNFLSNAAKFSSKDSEVNVTISHDENKVRVAVSDLGAGIPDTFRARIFERFAQAESSDTRSHGGTGLGLAISKDLIEKHNGEIGFYDNSPQGTTFYFDLPVSPDKQHVA